MSKTEFKCLPTIIGSMPHADPQKACSLIVRYLKDIPAWPQLPRRSFLENMYVQYSEGFPGAVIKNDRIYAIVPNVNSHNQFKAGIFTVTGRRIYSATIRANNAAVNIPAKGFPAGRYIMSITDDSNRALSSAFLLIR